MAKRTGGARSAKAGQGKGPLDSLRWKVMTKRRPAFKPVVEDGDGPANASKISGKAYIPEGEVWPTCPNCKRPMQLFVQIDLDKAGTETGLDLGKGLMQMFYCTSFEPNCENATSAWVPFSSGSIIRIVVPRGKGRDIPMPEIERAFPPKVIVGWERFDDYPGLDELPELGIHIPDSLFNKVLDDCQAKKWPEPAWGDKLGGWPAWCQSPEYPECRKCGKTMRLLYQIDSEDKIPYMWGDSGTGHICQCDEHKDVVAFGWACH